MNAHLRDLGSVQLPLALRRGHVARRHAAVLAPATVEQRSQRHAGRARARATCHNGGSWICIEQDALAEVLAVLCPGNSR